MSDNFIQYVNEYRTFKEKLFGLYKNQGAVLEKKEVPWTLSTTCGYRLASWDKVKSQTKLTGSSIGEDEVKIFFDICRIVKPSASYVIGHAFGLSTFCLALAYPENHVIAIDNWSEGEEGSIAKKLTESIIETNRLSNVSIYTGSSPKDTPSALACIEKSNKGKLSLAFIDGLHTNEAASADFTGILPYLDEKSVVLWHNVHVVSEAFDSGYNEKEKLLFDQKSVLRTHGPLGIYYSKNAHPLLHIYLKDSSLEWPRWEKYITILTKEKWILDQLALREKPLWKAASALYRKLKSIKG
jgi:predicted O-methyltransferase YrrM